jgi:hypothetical protein
VEIKYDYEYEKMYIGYNLRIKLERHRNILITNDIIQNQSVGSYEDFTGLNNPFQLLQYLQEHILNVTCFDNFQLLTILPSQYDNLNDYLEKKIYFNDINLINIIYRSREQENISFFNNEKHSQIKEKFTTFTPYGIVSIKSNATTAYAGLNVFATGNGNFTYVNHDNNVGIIGTEFGTGGTGHTPLTFQAGGSERMRISTAGDVFINHPLNIGEGRLRVSQDNSLWNVEIRHTFSTQYFLYFKYNSAGVGSVTGNGSNVSYNTSSDIRLKENIKPIENAISKVAKLKPVTYNWKSTGMSDDGFIAQDLLELDGFKHRVNTIGKGEDGDELYGVDYMRFTAVLTAAIQELKSENDTLKEILQRNNIQ